MQNQRRVSIPVKVGSIVVGGGAPIVVQSMTDTDTVDVSATVRQILALAQAGSELVRLTVNTAEAAAQVGAIKDQLLAQGCKVPLVGDFHYNGHELLTQYPECAQALSKYRINPGNVGFGKKKDSQFNSMIETALKYDKPVRIGVNWGSLDKVIAAHFMDLNASSSHPQPAAVVLRQALIESALSSANAAQQLGMNADRIILSCKVSSVQDLVAVYEELAARSPYALHLGLTEAGMGSKGIVASSIAMGILLQQGIGDTLRTSLTPKPGASRTEEVVVSQQILQTLGLRSFSPLITACPGCGRTSSDYFRELTEIVDLYLAEKMPEWRKIYPGVENMTVAVMGCVVNGPGESKHANIGISLPGKGEVPVAPVFIDGKKVMTLRGERLSHDFLQIIEHYVETKYRVFNSSRSQEFAQK